MHIILFHLLYIPDNMMHIGAGHYV